MKTLLKLFAAGLVFICMFLLSLFETYVILSISNLYKLTEITKYPFIQIYGLVVIVALVRYNYKKSEDNSFEQSLKDAFARILSVALVILLTWGLSFIAYYIIN